MAQSGDRRALDRLLRDHQMALLRHARTILREEEAALDAVQASLLLIARRLGTLRDPRWFRAWAYRITTREAVRIAKRRGRDRALIDDDAGMEFAAAPEAEPLAWDARICDEQVARLPPGAASVVRLHYLEELTLLEIAEAMEIPLGTVKSRLAYGLARLREMMACGTNAA